jgi:hypothetical protein
MRCSLQLNDMQQAVCQRRPATSSCNYLHLIAIRLGAADTAQCPPFAQFDRRGSRTALATHCSACWSLHGRGIERKVFGTDREPTTRRR